MNTNGTLDIDKLNMDIMNIPCKVSEGQYNAAVAMAYKLGHRDARHAACEVLLEHNKNVNPSEDLLVFAIQVEKLLCAALGREWSTAGISIESLIAELAHNKTSGSDGTAAASDSEPTMLWDADDPEDGVHGDSPQDFAESYASNSGVVGEIDVDVLCAYRGGKRTMRIVAPEDGRVSWSWADNAIAAHPTALTGQAAGTPLADERALFENAMLASYGGDLTREDLDALWSELPGYAWRRARAAPSPSAEKDTP
jgi:hypothetical protein